MTALLRRMQARRHHHLQSAGHAERGASPASVLLLLVVILMVAELILLGGRVAAAKATVSGAAQEAARRGSLVQSGSAVRAVANHTALQNLELNTKHCLTSNVSTAGTNFRPGGQVRVTVSCRVQMSDLSLLSLPWGTQTYESTATEIVETYRATE